MPSTTSFHDTIRERANDDSEFRIGLLQAAAEALVSGDLDEGKAALRLYIKSTTGYDSVADVIGMHPKSLIRMLGPEGNPRASNLVAILSHAALTEDIHLEVKATSVDADRNITAAST